jgi:hypothetical protein
MKPHCILIPLDNRINRRITFAFYYIAHGQSDEVLLREYAHSGGAPNCAPSLRSVAGLLVAR